MTDKEDVETFSENYTITAEELRSDVKLPFILLRLTLLAGAVLANIGLVYYLLATRYNLIGVIEYELAAAIIAGLSIFILGIIGGRFWIGIGYRLSRATYNVYLKKGKGILQRIFSYLYLRFSEPNNKIYLEARAKDPRLNNPFSLLKLIFNISVSQLSFFMLATAFLARPVVSYLRNTLPKDNLLIISESNQLIAQNVGAMGVAVIIMAFYIPMNYIMKDSNIRTWNTKNLNIGTPSQKLRSRIDSLVGLGALFTGWGIYMEETQGGQIRLYLTDVFWVIEGYDLAVVLDYLLWLATLLVLAWPLIVPASIYYFNNHGKTVNKFRAEASSRGVPIGISMVRLPNPEEKQKIMTFEQMQLEDTDDGNESEQNDEQELQDDDQ